ELLVEPRPARGELCGQRVTVARWTAEHGVRDVALVAGEPHLLPDEAVEELARAAHEGQTLLVLLGARALAHEHEVGVRVAHAEHDLRASPGEGTARTGRGLLLHLEEGGHGGPCYCRRLVPPLCTAAATAPSTARTAR